MIVTDTTGAQNAANHPQQTIRWSCLARRGMLHSECEAIDYLELAPQATLTSRGRSGTAEAWYVLAGQANFNDPTTARPKRAGPGSLVLQPGTTASNVHNPCPNTPLRLLLIAVMPPAITDRLPQRRPSIQRKPR